MIFGTALLLSLGILSAPAHAATGFAGGNVFEYTSASGNVYVNCPRTGGGIPSGPSSASYRCYGYIFSPADSAGFVGPVANADEVELTAYHQDGSTRTKSSSYDGARGHSTDAFNLWIETLFQRPLLNLGRNNITFALKDNGRVIGSGNFVADVYQKPDIYCPTASMTGWNPDDCTNSANVCAEYFNQYGRQCH